MTAVALDRRVLSALDASPPRIPVILGGAGTGRTTLLHRVRDRLGRTASQYIDVERSVTTPERFFHAVASSSPFHPAEAGRQAASPRAAFDATLAFLDTSRAAGGDRATFLLDETLEIRTFENFPGLRHVLRDLFDALAASHNRFVLTTRYVVRATRLMRDASPQFLLLHVPPLTSDEIAEALPTWFLGSGGGLSGALQLDPHERAKVALAVQALSGGRVAYARAIVGAMAGMGEPHGGDPVSSLTALLVPDGRLCVQCGFWYELRLHRARGYGALKAILDILAEEEPLTLTDIAHRLRRTPGSTKDYLSSLEDVDLITVHQKRYRFSDPLLRVWVRLYCRPSCPSDEEVAREVQAYAMARLTRAPEPNLALAGSSPGDREGGRGRSWGIIEID